MAWYQGPTLIELLESLSVYDESHHAPFRFPVQLVARHNGHEANDFRGYMGRIEAGKVSVGDKLVVQPSGQVATVKDIVTLEGSHASAVVGQSITLLLERTPRHLARRPAGRRRAAGHPAQERGGGRVLDVGRAARPAPQVLDQARHPPDRRQGDQGRHASSTSTPSSAIRPKGSKLNDIARIALTVQQPLAADAYDDIRATGAFILIDEVTHQTVAAGMIRLDA